MVSRRTGAPKPRPAHHLVSLESEIRGTIFLEPGDEFRVKGTHETFRFIEHVWNLKTMKCWITCYGGSRDPNAYRSIRSFHASDITRVLRKPKLG